MNTTQVNILKLTAEAVDHVFHECLWEEINDKAVAVEGVVIKAQFAQKQIDHYHPMIYQFLRQLPLTFRKNGSGGGSFLNLCWHKDGHQWADLHQTMDKLVCLGKAIGKLTTTTPGWNKIMPGGMPFVFIDVGETPDPQIPNTIAGPQFSFSLIGDRPEPYPALTHLLMVASRWAAGETLHVLTSLDAFSLKLHQELYYMEADDFNVKDLQLQWLDEKRVLAIASKSEPDVIYATIGLTPKEVTQ